MGLDGVSRPPTPRGTDIELPRQPAGFEFCEYCSHAVNYVFHYSGPQRICVCGMSASRLRAVSSSRWRNPDTWRVWLCPFSSSIWSFWDVEMAFAGVIAPAAGGGDWDVWIREKPVDMCKYIRQRAFYVKSLPRKGRNHLASDSARRLRAATISSSALAAPVQ